jgi:hypothetical protein
LQEVFEEGATIIPVILASDKTHLSNFTGDKSAWPVYLMIGNIEKSVRRKPSAHASILIGYIPVSNLECFSKSKHQFAGYQLFHNCMRSLLDPLRDAGTNGVDIVCTDGFIQRAYPILSAYVAVKMGGFILRITPITEPAKPIYYWAVVVRGVDED